MSQIESVKVLMNNVHFYRKNISILLKLLPNYEVNLKWSDRYVSYNFSGPNNNSSDDIEVLMDVLPALSERYNSKNL